MKRNSDKPIKDDRVRDETAGHTAGIMKVDGATKDEKSKELIRKLKLQLDELKLQNEKLLRSKGQLESTIRKIEEVRRTNEEKFRIISINTPEHVSMQDCELRYTWVLNPQQGLSESEMLGKTDFDILPAEEAKKLTNIKKRVLETGKPESIRIPVRDRNGTINYFEGSYAPLRGQMNGITGLIGYFRNITERVNVDNELSQTKVYLEQLINYANAPIIVWNPSSEIILFNKAFERLTGYSSEEVLGKKLDILFPDPSLNKSKAKIRQTLYGDFWESIEIPILCKSGETKIVLWNSANIYDNDQQNHLSTIAQGNDITSRKKAENELRESQRKLNLALENGKIGVWELDVRTRKFVFDDRMKKMSGLGNRPFDGSLKSFEKHINDEDVQHFNEALRRTLEENKPFETIFRVKEKQRGNKYLIVKGMLYNDDGDLSRIIGVGIDITEMKKGSEHALFKLNEELARSNKELEQFAYVASHDLQEPLRMVSIFTQMLAQRYGDTLDENAREYIKFAVDGSKRMYNLINGLLAYSRIQTKGKEFTQVDINNVLEEVQRNLSLQIEKSKAVIRLSGIPVISADRSQMIQLFQNLISNSLKFSNGTPVIKVSSLEHEDYYLFSVKDKGIGIDPQYFDRIFQIFQRLLPREEYEGTGIGLSVCKRIVERHGGKIWVESEPGKGSTFWFTIKKSS